MPDFQSPFRPAGVARALLGSFGVSTQATLITRSGDWQALVFNRSSTQDAYLAYGPSSTAVAGSSIPLETGLGNAATGHVVPIPSRSLQTFTFSGPTFFGILVPAGGNTAIIDITPGTGS